VVHVLFYVVILGMIASGIGMMALSGAAVLMFGGESALLPDFWNYPPRIPHGIGARLLLVLLMLHVGNTAFALKWRSNPFRYPKSNGFGRATLMCPA
jgi:cytochrome b561